MKRDFDEISEEEWSQHSFNPSRVLKRPRTPKRTRPTNPSPPIESFAFRRPSKAAVGGREESDSSSDDCVEVEDLGESDSEVKIVNGDDLLLEDEEEDAKVVVRAARAGRRFVIEDDEASEDEFDDDEVELSSSEDEGGRGGREEEDVVGKALQKCAKISADLRKELYGSSSGVTCDRYSEVETSTVRIVTQVL